MKIQKIFNFWPHFSKFGLNSSFFLRIVFRPSISFLSSFFNLASKFYGFPNLSIVKGTSKLNFLSICTDRRWPIWLPIVPTGTGGKPSTWFPPERLVEHFHNHFYNFLSATNTLSIHSFQTSISNFEIVSKSKFSIFSFKKCF